MKLKTMLAAGAVSLISTGAWAGCAFENDVPIKSLSAGFEAWKAVTDAMAECGNVEAELDQEFREKQPSAFEANPSLYHIGGVANSTMVPLLNAGTIRPLDDLVEKYGQNLTPNQLIKVDGQTMAIAMMVNTQHLMYREDIFSDLGLEVPTTYQEMLDAAAKIQEAGVVEYPIGGTFKSGWNLGEEFINMYIGEGGSFFGEGNMPAINNEQGVASLEMLKALTEYMDPEYLVSDSTYVQQQFQQGKIAIANLWASRAGAMDDEAESQVVGKVKMAAAPMGSAAPATTLWWDGLVFATNMTDEEADAAFRVAMEGIDEEMVKANNDTAVWLINGYEPGEVAMGAAATAAAGALPYPASGPMGIMHTALGNGVAAFLTGDKDAETTLADIEAEYTTAAKEAGLVQ
ncbi:ABC transporter substrate-binding protein [Oceanomicrobium pacificus]|uniref:Extracellular solute-binding protein n=1 Tax=Oceanomicrobium pacificus TaxID=2692916 RepID=A0A6B0TJW9_9RHOB|nr:extracellular solute-binding protein [Oceanomicrobium pacificus]MXU64790.1 extracellular solute-binding protein [Oceanomicrobium pacificus]